MQETVMSPNITVRKSIAIVNPSKVGPNCGQSRLTIDTVQTLFIVIAYIYL